METTINENGKYAILADNTKYFQGAVMTGLELKAKYHNLLFEIVLINSVVKDLETNTDLVPLVEECKKATIKIVLCEMAMQQLEVEKSNLPASLLTTHNAFTYVFELQELGYKVITL